MLNYFLCLLGVLSSGCHTARYYIVRHAEKETATTMMSDVPLSRQGNERALALKDLLLNKNIKRIFSTNYIRTKATAQPLREATGIGIEIYNPADSVFVRRLKNSVRGTVLIVGHSNTVDDLVNALTGRNRLRDLPDTQYGDLFIVTKKGTKYSYSKSKFGL